MTDADWLLALASRLDNAPERAAYADWLDDHDDPRAGLLRLDMALCDAPADDPRRVRLAELAASADVWWRMHACRVPLDHGEPTAPGRDWPWYTLGCGCGGPQAVAPELFGDGDRLLRQPATPAEHWLACLAAFACDQAVRYGGRDPAVIGMLGNHPAYSDFLVRQNAPEVYLDRQPDPYPDDSDEFDMLNGEVESFYAGPPPALPPASPPAGLLSRLGRLFRG